MTGFTLKIIAIISMFLDHVKYAIPSTNCFATIYLGRIAFPIFAFLVSEGFVHTHSRPKYILRMLIFAIISEIPFYMFSHDIVNSPNKYNVMFTFLLALVGLWCFEYFRNYEQMPKILRYTIIFNCGCIISLLAYVFHPDYSVFGVFLVWIFYYFKEHDFLKIFGFSISLIIYFALRGGIKEYGLMIATLSSLIFILNYNGKQGRKLKYFFYLFYPVHFIVLYVINYFLY